MALPLGYGAWLVYVDAPAYRLLVRLYVDKHFVKETLREWGILAPVLFMVLQALQVIISPIPGEATGFLGGYPFGEWLGLLYSRGHLGLGAGGQPASRPLFRRWGRRRLRHRGSATRTMRPPRIEYGVARGTAGGLRTGGTRGPWRG